MRWKRLVIKVGTNVLTDSTGQIDVGMIDQLVAQIAKLKDQGKEVILVTSGAVGAGKSVVQLPEKINSVTKRQVYSSIGQIELMSKYKFACARHNILCAQVLATKEDFRDRIHYVNMKRCLLALLRDNILPIVNENDVISISELMFTDNDELAGWIGSLVNASEMIILSSVDGVLSAAGKGPVISTVQSTDSQVYKDVTAGKSDFGRGGMLTKIRICQKAASNGIHAYIANGRQPDIINSVISGEALHTHFPADKRRSPIKKWIAQSDGDIQGQVWINQGAEQALTSDSVVASLLPIGVLSVSGNFKKGDLIQILNYQGNVIGVGISAFSSKKAQSTIGVKDSKALIHYDYLLIYQ